MTIKFHCEHCHKVVSAPDESGGRRGTCPYCGQSNYIPSGETEELPLAPVDEEDERRRQKEVEDLLKAEREVLAETSRTETEPRLRQKGRDEVSTEDVHHLVVNFCLDMYHSQLERADTHVMQLNEYPSQAAQAVREFQQGKAIEPALDIIPAKLLQGLLRELQGRLR